MIEPAQLPAQLIPGPDYDRQWYVDRFKQLAALRDTGRDASHDCPHCTFRALKRAKFCGRCGTEISVLAYSPPVPKPLQRPTDPTLAALFDARANEVAEVLKQEAVEQALAERIERAGEDLDWCGTIREDGN